MKSYALIAAIIAASLIAAFSWAGVATLASDDPCRPLSSMFDTVAQCRAVEALRERLAHIGVPRATALQLRIQLGKTAGGGALGAAADLVIPSRN